jgi:hypothetical protein
MARTPPQVGIAACRAFQRADSTDLHPDADWPLLSAELADAGVVATSVAWGNEEVDWGQFDLVVVNST